MCKCPEPLGRSSRGGARARRLGAVRGFLVCPPGLISACRVGAYGQKFIPKIARTVSGIWFMAMTQDKWMRGRDGEKWKSGHRKATRWIL